MSPEESSLNETINMLKNRIEGTEKKISRNLEDLGAASEKLKVSLGRTTQLARRVLTDRRTYFIAGGIVVGYMALRMFMGRNEGRAVSVGPKRAVVVAGRQRSLLHELLIVAIQTFVLHYARKLLKDYLEKQEASASKPA